MPANFSSKSPDSRSGKTPRAGSPIARIILLALVVVICGVLAILQNYNQPARASDLSESILLSTASGLLSTVDPRIFEANEPQEILPTDAPSLRTSLVYSSMMNGVIRLWILGRDSNRAHPLTDETGDARFPAVSPDGGSLAFTSNRNGFWDIYLMDLGSGAIRQVTATPGFEGRLSWSPDGKWLVYEGFYEDDFDIWILPVDAGQAPLQLTDHPAADTSPTWDPGGRKIVFVSDRSGSSDLYIADLDRPTEPFQNITVTAAAEEGSPVFHPSRSSLAYSYRAGSNVEIRMLDLAQSSPVSWSIGRGESPAWSAGGEMIYAIVHTPQEDQIAGYALESGGDLSGSVPHSYLYELDGMAKVGSYEMISFVPVPEPLFTKELESDAGGLSRVGLIELEDVNPRGIQLSDHADEAFQALQSRVAQEAGWSFLDNLDNGFVGINDPLPPGFAYNDWLFTGRAFAFSQAFFQAGWVEIVREDFAGETYWRVFIRTERQDGSLGMPLRSKPWDFLARYEGDPNTYDQGGGLKERIPPGYYIDFTSIARKYGFSRLPALSNWRTFYHGARFTEFVFMEGLDWTSAMLQLYPPSAIVTPTLFLTPTLTPTNTPWPTATPWWWQWRTPTPSESPPTSTPPESSP